MPGYRGHLFGGCIAYSMTLGVVLSVFPTLMFHAAHASIALLPAIVQSLYKLLYHYVPSLVRSHVFISQSPWLVLFEWFLCALAGSLFPDIDIKSKGQKLFYWILVGVFCVLLMTDRSQLTAYLSICAFTPMLVNHRGLFHRWWFLLMISLGLWWMASLRFPYLQYAFLLDLTFFYAGAISHLWLDMGFKRMIRI